ncbi:MAG: ThuA domain-containing protein [Pirellulaceae bacterium]|nr:ThuA domain-containing protein [Pirellulaceae bacterium]
MKATTVLATLLAAISLASGFAFAQADETPPRVAIVVGPSTHPPGTHEVAAGGRLMKFCLENMANVPGVKADVLYQWPRDPAVLEGVATVVFIGDIFPPMRLPDPPAILAQLDAMMKRGCGIVCVHYATGLRAGDVGENGEHPLLGWMGGYFATGCNHHRSVAKIFREATVTPAAPEHPVSRGWREFTFDDEPYIQNYFGPDGNKLSAGVTALATSMLPPEAPQREIVAWGIQRADGGRGVGIVMPHYYRNWKLEDLRRMILNSIVWTANLEVPAQGVQTTLPDLAVFEPGGVEPLPPAAKKPKNQP